MAARSLQFSLAALLLLMAVAAVLCFALTNPIPLVALATQTTLFVLSAVCIVLACNPSSAYRWPATAALLTGFVCHELTWRFSVPHTFMRQLLNFAPFTEDSEFFAGLYDDTFQSICEMILYLAVSGSVALIVWWRNGKPVAAAENRTQT